MYTSKFAHTCFLLTYFRQMVRGLSGGPIKIMKQKNKNKKKCKNLGSHRLNRKKTAKVLETFNRSVKWNVQKRYYFLIKDLSIRYIFAQNLPASARI